MQGTRVAEPASNFNVAPIAATIIGIPAVAIVLAALSDGSAPIVGRGTGAVVALWILITLMCSRGIASMQGRNDLILPILAGVAFGIAATFLFLSDFFGWPLLLQPIANALGSSGAPATFDRATIVGVGAIMAVKWAIAWTSYLPRKA